MKIHTTVVKLNVFLVRMSNIVKFIDI